MHTKLLRVICCSVVFGFVTQARAVCDQIAPNPDPVGNIITNTSADGCNELTLFDDYGSLNNNSTLENFGQINNSNELFNSGSLTGLVTFDGETLAFGNSPRAMSILGEYTQSFPGSFEVKIGGQMQGITYDFQDVADTETLEDLLDVSLYDFGTGLFSPKLGDTFDVPGADIILDSSSAFSFVRHGVGLGWQASNLTDTFATTD